VGDAEILNNRHIVRMGARGSSLLELSVGLVVLIPIVLFLFDLCVIVLNVQVNDSTCREAARIAASGNPLDAQARAMAVINRANSSPSSMLSNFTLLNLNSTVTAQDISALGTYGGPVKGTVTVTTQVDVRPFIVQYVFAGKAPLRFISKQSFPFTYLVPNTTPAAQ